MYKLKKEVIHTFPLVYVLKKGTVGEVFDQSNGPFRAPTKMVKFTDHLTNNSWCIVEDDVKKLVTLFEHHE